MKLKVYAYEGCSTCKKALAYLKKRKIAFDILPIVDHPPTQSELKTMLRDVGQLGKLFNTSGVLYREMKMSDKLPKISEAEALALLSKNGKLVKRPFVLGGARGLVGFREAEWDEVL